MDKIEVYKKLSTRSFIMNRLQELFKENTIVFFMFLDECIERHCIDKHIRQKLEENYYQIRDMCKLASSDYLDIFQEVRDIVIECYQKDKEVFEFDA